MKRIYAVRRKKHAHTRVTELIKIRTYSLPEEMASRHKAIGDVDCIHELKESDEKIIQILPGEMGRIIALTESGKIFKYNSLIEAWEQFPTDILVGRIL